MSKKFKNINEFFNNQGRDKSKCLNIIDNDFINETASNISPEKLSDDEKNEIVKKSNSNPNSNKKPPRIRTYDDSYIKFGFSCKNENSIDIPLCVICGEALANSSLIPNKMMQHLETQHPELKSKEEGFFRAKLNNFNSQKQFLSESLGIEVMSGVTEASYRVSHLIGTQGKPHTIAESLILPCAKVMVECVLGEKAAKKLEKIPLSNDTVSRRIDDIALQVKNNLIEMIRKSRFYALQLDESNDMSKFAELMAYVRFEDDGKIKEEYLFCEAIKTNTTADAIFEKV